MRFNSFVDVFVVKEGLAAPMIDFAFLFLFRSWYLYLVVVKWWIQGAFEFVYEVDFFVG